MTLYVKCWAMTPLSYLAQLYTAFIPPPQLPSYLEFFYKCWCTSQLPLAPLQIKSQLNKTKYTFLYLCYLFNKVTYICKDHTDTKKALSKWQLEAMISSDKCTLSDSQALDECDPFKRLHFSLAIVSRCVLHKPLKLCKSKLCPHIVSQCAEAFKYILQFSTGHASLNPWTRRLGHHEFLLNNATEGKKKHFVHISQQQQC